MIKTHHLETRMNQRGITAEMIQIVNEFGDYYGDKQILDRKGCLFALTQYKKMFKSAVNKSGLKRYKKLFQAAQKIANKGGLVIVNVDEVQITTYRLKSKKGIRK